MGITNIVQNVKEIHKDHVVLVKVGTFYNCYGRDSYILSYLFGYKIILTKDGMYNCAFPESSLNKVIAKLEENKINYIILDKRNNYDVDNKENYKDLNNYLSIYEKAKKKISIKLRVEKIYQYLLFCNNEKTIFEVEKVINERRKIQGD